MPLAYSKQRVQRAKALTGWETRWEPRLLPLLSRPVIYSSAGLRGFGGWPPIEKKSIPSNAIFSDRALWFSD
jgi:hypothetical protein